MVQALYGNDRAVLLRAQVHRQIIRAPQLKPPPGMLRTQLFQHGRAQVHSRDGKLRPAGKDAVQLQPGAAAEVQQGAAVSG